MAQETGTCGYLALYLPTQLQGRWPTVTAPVHTLIVGTLAVGLLVEAPHTA